MDASMAEHTHAALHDRALAAGVPPFVWDELHPDWWDDECLADPGLLPEMEIAVARLLGCSIVAVRDPLAALPAFDAVRYADVRRCPDDPSFGWRDACMDEFAAELDQEFGKGACL